MPTCEEAALDPTADGSLCAEHHKQTVSDSPSESDDTDAPHDDPATWLPESVPGLNTGVWSTLTEGMTSLMCAPRGSKNAFGPEGEENNPDAPCTGEECPDDVKTTDDPRCQCDARYKWTIPANWMDFATAREWAEMDPTLSDSIMVVLQREGEAYREPADPGMLIDGDDVIDKNGNFHPEFLDVIHDLADEPGYVSVSSSEQGAHVPLIGTLPDGVKQLKIPLSMDVPGFDTSHVDSEGDGLHIDIFDGKHLRKATGKHVEGTPREPANIDAEALDEYCEEYGASLTTTVTETHDDGTTIEREVTMKATAEYTGPDPDEWEVPADSCLEYHAAVEAHYHGHSTGNFWRVTGAAAAWGQQLGKSPAEIIDDLRGVDRPGTSVGFGGKTEQRIHADWRRAANGAFEPHSRRRLAEIGVLPARYAIEDNGGGTPISALPLAQLDALSPEERRRAARKRGCDWPTTDQARERLFQTITEVMKEGDKRVIDAPTALGKSHTIAATAWDAPQFDQVTGERPIVHLHKTTDARDEAVKTSQTAEVDHFVLVSRKEACPTAAGEYDPQEDDDNDQPVITIDGEPASVWLDQQCDGKGIPFSAAHRHLEDHNDQDEDLPCCGGEGDCWAMTQWKVFREGDHRLVHATHNFAFVPGLRAHTNIAIDEELDFAQELTTDRVRDAVGAYLREINAPVETWEGFIQLSQYDGYGDDAGTVREAVKHTLDKESAIDWYISHEDAHILAPALARAIFNAEDRGNGRRVGKTPFEPPRLDAHASEDDGWNREWVTVVLDEANDVRTVRTVPDFSQARSVIGLDAHPAMPKWQANSLPYIERKRVLAPDERRLWRRYERGLRVVQVGTATRPLASEHASSEYFNATGTRAIIEQLYEDYGQDFRTAITTKRVETELRTLMRDAGVNTPETMHYGEEKSRNDFANEAIGFVNGCIDPGDDHIIDLLAELDLDALPERSEHDCTECHGDGCEQCAGTGKSRAHGRGFVGENADEAAAILASVRENHTAQAAGRYARNPDDPHANATVFVRTDATPIGFADVQVPGVVWAYGDKQQQLAAHLREQSGQTTAKEAAEELDISKQHVHATLKKWVEYGVVQEWEGSGAYGATLYADAGVPNTGVAVLQDDDDQTIINSPVQDSSTYGLTIREPSAPISDVGREPTPHAKPTAVNEGGQATLEWVSTTDDGGGQE